MARVGYCSTKNSNSNALNLISNYVSDDDDEDEEMINVDSIKRNLDDNEAGPSKLLRTENRLFLFNNNSFLLVIVSKTIV